MKQILFPVLDRAHGSNVAGKGSPATLVPNKFNDDNHLTFREWEWSEEVIDIVHYKLSRLGYKVYRTVTDNDTLEPGLSERIRRINAVPEQYIMVISVHVNAAGMGDEWKNADFVSVWTCKGQTGSDSPATRLFECIKKEFPELKMGKDMSDGDPDYEANFYALVAKGWAVLVEFGFQDNKSNVAFLKLKSTKERYATVLTNWFINENNKLVESTT